MVELIKSWLVSKSYALGVELYNRYGDSQYLKSLFQEGEDYYNRRKLESELIDLLKSVQNEDQIIESEKSIFSPSTPLEKEVHTKPLPVEVKECISKRKSLYARARVNKDKLINIYLNDKKDSALATNLALEILDIFDQIKPLWDYTNYFDKYQKLPAVIVPTTDYEDYSDVDLNKLYYNNYKYISKNKKLYAKREMVNERINECYQIQNLLTSRDAFQHTGINIPTIEQLNDSYPEREAAH